MAGHYKKKQKIGDVPKGGRMRSPKKQAYYDSGSSESEAAAGLKSNIHLSKTRDPSSQDEDGDFGPHFFGDEAVSARTTKGINKTNITNDLNSDSDSNFDSDVNSNPNLTRKRKRNDPDAFATSITKILSTKLSTSKRADPVLSRSAAALQTAESLNSSKLETKARQRILQQKKAALENGRVKDVLGLENANLAEERESVGEILEMEKRLRKTAQRGVIKLFNAVRAAQVKGEQAAREVRAQGVVGAKRSEEEVTKMSKRGFLELVAGGGVGKLDSSVLEEA
ncbi:MAG: hypothetical protein M1824_001317 [Vezdaea acicularis]|nr:MAG: hypothetical protein M1824_001317 [Vezdaea acicularis]